MWPDLVEATVMIGELSSASTQATRRVPRTRRAGASRNLPNDLVFIGVAAVMLLAGSFLFQVAGSPRAAVGRDRS